MSNNIGIVKAIYDYKDHGGSSLTAIKKHMQDAFPSDKKWVNTVFLAALKSGVAKGDLVQTKIPYKLSPDYKKQLVTTKK